MVKILVTRQIPDHFIEQLEQFGDVKMWEEAFEPMPREQFLKELEDVDACFITLSEKIDATCLEHAKHVKVIANMAVGFDNIDVKLVKTKKLSLLIHLKYLRKQRPIRIYVNVNCGTTYC